MELPPTSLAVSTEVACLVDSVKFVYDIEDKYICLICENILRPPVLQSVCGHRVCSVCVPSLFQNESEVPCPGGEDECDILRLNELYPDNATNKEILSLKVYCSNQGFGCTDISRWGKLHYHLDKCMLRRVCCPNEGCSEIFAVKDIKSHESVCDFTPLVCPSCNTNVTRIAMTSGHLDECKTKPKSCPLQPFGCQFTGNTPEMVSHSVDKISSHNGVIVDKVKAVSSAQNELSNRMANIDETIHKLRHMVQSEIPNSRASSTIQTLQEQVKGLDGELGELKSALSCHVTLDNFVECQESVRKVQQISASCETRLSQLEQENGRNGNWADAQGAVRRMESTVAMHDMRIAEADLRFRLLETAAFDGRLLWKINNYRRRKQDAVEGRTLSLYSQPFYSSYHGYKMCARVYLNGDGLGRNTHLSLFFVIMKHEYDSILQWPFRQKVTLSLMDQSGARKHISDAFRPDPTSSSFRKPVGEMNIASGSPMFASHDRVESADFLKDDTLFICMTIDKTDLTDPF